MREVIKKKVLKLLKTGVIYPVFDSEWVSPVQVVAKKGGMIVIRNEKNELWYLDGYSSYHQILIHPDDRSKTTCTCPYGTFTYRRMSFGLCNAPASFQRCMMAIFSDLNEKVMEVFMDDFSICDKTFEDCLANLDKVLKRCQMADLVLNWEKCHFMV
jgi:hypothetical protein